MTDNTLAEITLGNSNQDRSLSYQAFGKNLPATPTVETGKTQQASIGMEFWNFVNSILKYKWLILAITLIGTALAWGYVQRITPLYKSTVTIEFKKQEQKILNLDPSATGNVADREYMETQFVILRSKFLADRVVKRLGLHKNPLFADANLPKAKAIDNAANMVADNIRVVPMSRTRIAKLEYINEDPIIAAKVANSVIENYIDSTLERKYNETSYARKFISERMALAKKNLESSETALVQYAKEKNIFDLQKGTASSSLEVNSILSLNNALAEAQSELIDKEQAFLAVQAAPPTQSVLENRNIQNLKQKKLELESKYNEDLAIFKPQYPDMVQLRSQIDQIDILINSEQSTIVNSALATAEADYLAAKSKVESLSQQVGSLKGTLQGQQDSRIQYTILAFLGSLLSSIGLAWGLSFIDDTIKTIDDVKKKLGLPALAVVPKLMGVKKRDLIISELKKPKSPITEAFVSARTFLEFSTEGGAPKSILFTSTQPGEGKSSSTVSIAVSFARLGKKVLIIDADMRKPSFVGDARVSIGLSGLLTSDEPLAPHVIESDVKGLYILPGGVIPPNPAELLSGFKIRQLIEEAEGLFDLVVVDSPPVLGFADSPSLGRICEGAILVIKSGKVRSQAAQRTVSRLVENGANMLGVILMQFDVKNSGYETGYYYAYGQGAYEYSTKKKVGSESYRKIALVDGIFSEDTEEELAEEQPEVHPAG